jgi:hypothetical protein
MGLGDDAATISHYAMTFAASLAHVLFEGSRKVTADIQSGC